MHIKVRLTELQIEKKSAFRYPQFVREKKNNNVGDRKTTIVGNYKDRGKRDRVIVIEHFHGENHRAQRIRVHSRGVSRRRTRRGQRG